MGLHFFNTSTFNGDEIAINKSPGYVTSLDQTFQFIMKSISSSLKMLHCS